MFCPSNLICQAAVRTHVVQWTFMKTAALLLAICAGLFAQQSGYLTASEIQSLVGALPPPPVDKDARDTADRAIFLNTRALKDGPRWTLAQSDNNLGVIAILKDFQCSSAMLVDPQKTP